MKREGYRYLGRVRQVEELVVPSVLVGRDVRGLKVGFSPESEDLFIFPVSIEYRYNEYDEDTTETIYEGDEEYLIRIIYDHLFERLKDAKEKGIKGFRAEVYLESEINTNKAKACYNGKGLIKILEEKDKE